MIDTSVSESPAVVPRARAYFAVSPRGGASPAGTRFDVVSSGRFDLDNPPSPWFDLGTVRDFGRHGLSKIDPLFAGAPASVATQVRKDLDATVRFTFDSFGKLQAAISCGTQQMNLLATAAGATVAAVAVQDGSTVTQIIVGAASTGFTAGDIIAADNDYGGDLGYIGAGINGAFVPNGATITDVDFMRRITFNVAVVASVDTTAGALNLASPLIVDPTGMNVQKAVGFSDREGARFFQEWSALFVFDGRQGDRVLLYYPRLQAAVPVEETLDAADGFDTLRLSSTYRALPVTDPIDGERVVCYRSFLPATLS